MKYIKVQCKDTPLNDHAWYGELANPYIVINQGVTRLFFSDKAYERFLATIC